MFIPNPSSSSGSGSSHRLANTVAYTPAFLGKICKDQKKSLDFQKIWATQDITPSLESAKDCAVTAGQLICSNAFYHLHFFAAKPYDAEMMYGELHKKLTLFTLEGEPRRYRDLAYESFFANLAEMADLWSLRDVEDLLGMEIFPQVNDCAESFFFTNEYETGNPADEKHWNAIDVFIRTQGDALPEKEKSYLRALRNSHVGVYRIGSLNDAEKEAGLLDMVENTKITAGAPETLYRHLAVNECFGFRILALDGRNHITYSPLPLIDSTAAILVEHLRDIHRAVIRLCEDAGSGEDVERLAKVMWAPEIATAYMADEMILVGESYAAAARNSAKPH